MTPMYVKKSWKIRSFGFFSLDYGDVLPVRVASPKVIRQSIFCLGALEHG